MFWSSSALTRYCWMWNKMDANCFLTKDIHEHMELFQKPRSTLHTDFPVIAKNLVSYKSHSVTWQRRLLQLKNCPSVRRKMDKDFGTFARRKTSWPRQSYFGRSNLHLKKEYVDCCWHWLQASSQHYFHTHSCFVARTKMEAKRLSSLRRPSSGFDYYTNCQNASSFFIPSNHLNKTHTLNVSQ